MLDKKVIITVTDIRKQGYCVSGIRSWFATHGLDFRLLLQQGVESDKLLATNDELARKVVEAKLKAQFNG
jgi:hypothetical protein